MSVGFLKTLVTRRGSKDEAMEAVYRLCREAELKIQELNRQAEERRTERHDQGEHAC
jgi:hypothetical protein